MRRKTSKIDGGVSEEVSLPSEKKFFEFLIQFGAWEQLDLCRPEVTEVAKRAKRLYGAIPAHALKEPAEGSSREKLIRALTIQIVILETLSGSGYRDLEWIRNALHEIRTGLREVEKGFTPPIFQARKRSPSAGREPHDQRVVKDTSVMAWLALQRLGMNKTKAAQMVADCITKRRFLPARHPTQKSVSARSILNWAERKSDGSAFDCMAWFHFTSYSPQTSQKRIIADLEEILEAYRDGRNPHLDGN
jgi:hypothetical protein